MPMLEIHIREGCTNAAIEACMKEIPKAICGTLTDVDPSVIRVSVFETAAKNVVQGGCSTPGFLPTVVFYLGPGKSESAIQACLMKLVDTIHETLGIEKDEIRIVIPRPDYFAVGGNLL